MFKLENYFPYMNEAGVDGADLGGAADTPVVESAPQESSTLLTDTQTEDKAVEDKATEDKPTEESKAEDEPTVNAPEKYEFEMPEGVEFNQESFDKFEPLFRDLDLTQEQAQKLVTAQTEWQTQANENYVNEWAKTQEKWVGDLKADTEFGGANFDNNVSVAKQAMERFGSDELKQALNETGMGNHPEIIKVFHRVGSAIAEDTFSNGDSGHGKPTLYPNSNMNQ